MTDHKIVGIVNFRDKVILATERGVYCLKEDTQEFEPIKINYDPVYAIDFDLVKREGKSPE